MSMIKITFLGTSGAIPTPKRNHPAILLSYNSDNILVDCGEGTQIQFKKAKISAAKTTKLLITHWHGDHVLGIPGLLQTLAFSNYNKIPNIYGPRGILENINNVLRAFPSVLVTDLRDRVKLKVFEAKGRFIDEKEFYIEAFPVRHGIPCNAYCFFEKDKLRIDKKKLAKFKIPSGKFLSKLKQGKDIIYNGKKYSAKTLTYGKKGKKICIVMDTLYDKSIVSFVKNADLLIMESTFTHESENLAERGKHMTAKKAAEIAKQAKVKKLILTHLSNRYDKNPEKVLKEAKKVFKNSFLAKDLDEIEVK